MVTKLIPPSTSSATRLASTPLKGELLFDRDEKFFYYGDGVTQGGLRVTAGAFGLRYTYSVNTIAPPRSGELRFNNANPSLATSIYVFDNDRYGANVSSILLGLNTGSALLVLDESNHSAWALYTLSSVVDNTSYVVLNVVGVGSSGVLSGDISLTFANKGDVGSTGSPGPPGVVSSASSVTLTQIATPADPGTGNTALYSKPDGFIYYLPNGGVEQRVGGVTFGTIAVSGQSDVVADQVNDTLTLVAGSNITLTTNAATDTVTIASSGGGDLTLTGTKTANYTAQNLERVPCNTTAGAFTITTPATGRFGVVDVGGNTVSAGFAINNLTIVPASGTIMGGASLILDVGAISPEFELIGSDWRIVSVGQPGSAGSVLTIEDEGTPLTQRTKLNFVGSGVTATDDAGNDRTIVTIAGGGGGGGGNYSYVTTLTATGGETFLEATGLTDEEYYVVGDFASTAEAAFDLSVNSDTTNANYWRQVILEYGSSNIIARQNSRTVGYFYLGGAACYTSLWIRRTVTGHFICRALSSYANSGFSITAHATSIIFKIETIASITSLRFSCSAGAMVAGSKFILYKLVTS